MTRTVVVDLDGTLCNELPTFERALATPKEGAKELLISLKELGYTIIIYTARGWAEFTMTQNWLYSNNLYYDVLLMGKPVYDIWIDDRAVNCDDNLSEIERWIKNGKSN